MIAKSSISKTESEHYDYVRFHDRTTSLFSATEIVISSIEAASVSVL